jgi:tetratricopeptide (TPR) repeat protein
VLELAMSFVRAGDYNNALAVFDTAMALPTRHASAASFYNKAVVLCVLQRYEEVLLLLKEPVPQDLPEGARHFLDRLGEECVRRLGLHRIEATQEAVDELFGIGMDAHDAEQFETMNEVFAAVLDRDPEMCLAWNNKADALMKSGQLDEAFICVHMALALDEQSSTCWCTLGEILARAGVRSEALRCWDYSYRLNPTEKLADYIDREVERRIVRGTHI